MTTKNQVKNLWPIMCKHGLSEHILIPTCWAIWHEESFFNSSQPPACIYNLMEHAKSWTISLQVNNQKQIIEIIWNNRGLKQNSSCNWVQWLITSREFDWILQTQTNPDRNSCKSGLSSLPFGLHNLHPRV